MKKISIFLLLFIISLIFFLTTNLQSACFAATEASEDLVEDLGSTVSDTLGDLDLNEYQSFIDSLGETQGISIKQLVNDILHNSNDIDFDYFIKFAFQGLFKQFSSLLPKLAIIIAVALLYGLLQKLTSDFSKQSTKKLVYIACYGTILTVVLFIVSDVITSTIKTIDLLSKFTDISFPILLTLISAMGGSASVAVYQPMVLVFSAVIIKIIKIAIMPLFYITFVFGIIGNLSDELKLSKFAKTSKKLADWIMGIVFSLFITFLTAQGITGASFDSIAAKGAKFALSSYLPVVGSYLKEGFDIIIAGCLVIKNALGLCSIIILLFIVLMPILKLILIVFMLRIASAVIEPVSDTKFSEALYSTSNSLMILITILICLFFAMFIFIMMIIYTCNLGVV